MLSITIPCGMDWMIKDLIRGKTQYYVYAEIAVLRNHTYIQNKCLHKFFLKLETVLFKSWSKFLVTFYICPKWLILFLFYWTSSKILFKSISIEYRIRKYYDAFYVTYWYFCADI